MESKAEIRKNMINHLKNFDLDEKKQQTRIILQNLTDSSNWQRTKTVGLYMATPMEFDLTTLFASDKRILIPKCLPKRQMMFAHYEPEHLTRSAFGLLEPDGLAEEVPDFILVPGLAWNGNGFRVGFGGGYYDRYLAKFDGATASVFYDFQAVEFSAETHDIAVQELFTT